MKTIIGSYKEITNNEEITLTIGNFDGVHLGHQELLEKTRSFNDTKSAVMTFNPHPLMHFRKKSFYHLTSISDKLNIFASLKMDMAFSVNFDDDFANLTVAEFILFLKKLNIKRLILGHDFRFGSLGSGTINDLKTEFSVIIVPFVIYNNQKISSSYIRDMVTQGNITEANQMLDRYYEISGEVVKGNQIGEKLGFRTANIDYDNYLLPKNGVYCAYAVLDDQIYKAMVNIGNNPTVNFSPSKKMEVHILEFDEMIYGERLKVQFVSYLREEQKFSSKDELIKELTNNKKLVSKLLS